MEDVIADNRVAVQAVFDKIIALDAVVASTPPFTEDRMDVGTQRVVLDGEVTNALFIHADDLKSPNQSCADDIGGTYAGTIETCAQAMRGQPRGVPRGVEFALKDCGSAEYLFVLRARVQTCSWESRPSCASMFRARSPTPGDRLQPVDKPEPGYRLAASAQRQTRRSPLARWRTGCWSTSRLRLPWHLPTIGRPRSFSA